MTKERILVLDTETTGLNPDTDKIIEIGIIELNENMLTQVNFHEYINPERDISISAQKVHGITNDFLEDKPIFHGIAQKFLDFIKDDTIIIHNAAFDVSFINKELQNCGFNKLENNLIDTIDLAKKEFPGQSVSLDSLCRKLNVTNTRKDYHGALLDATLLSKVYLKLATGKQEKLNFITNNTITVENEEITVKFRDKFREPRSQLMKLTNDEKEKHREFICEMKDSIWKKIK